MKCPKCRNNHKKKDGPACSSCGYRFIFPDPTKGYELSDNQFANILKKVSANSTSHFLTGQVQAAIATRRPPLPVYIMQTIFLTLFFTVFFGGIINEFMGSVVFVAIVPVIVIGISIKLYSGSRAWPEHKEVSYWLEEWEERFGPLQYWVSSPSLNTSTPSSESVEQDIDAYGVQRLLIVDNELLVDVLIKNHWHTDHQTLVVSASGYPSSVTELVNRYLSKNPNLIVYLFHSSHAENFREQIVSAGKILLKEHQVNDLGITPSMIKNLTFFKKHYEKAPGGRVGTDQLPNLLMHNVMASCIVGGVTMTTAMASYSTHSPIYFEADFG
jgi:DNA-directed RNA polymerase subunit RPC12/RpoP